MKDVEEVLNIGGAETTYSLTTENEVPALSTVNTSFPDYRSCVSNSPSSVGNHLNPCEQIILLPKLIKVWKIPLLVLFIS